jgi:multidrug efflux pump subunit AcrA (membrane-fusion protein)
MTIVDTRTLELSATLPSEALAGVQPGARLRFRVDAYPDEAFEGVVDRVNPTTEPGTRQLRIYTRIANPEGKLVGGLFVSGRVVTSARASALAAPVGALRTEGSGHVVYRLHGGRAQRVPVQLGLLDEAAGLAELEGELVAGDSLLTGVLPGIRDGVAVRVLDAAVER